MHCRCTKSIVACPAESFPVLRIISVGSRSVGAVVCASVWVEFHSNIQNQQLDRHFRSLKRD